MTIQEWGAVGEIVGGIAVLISLVYLALQIRQNTKQLKMGIEATRIASFEASVHSGNHIRELLVRDREITELFLRGLKSFAHLEGTDRFRMDMLLRNVFSEAQRSYVRESALGSEAEGPQRIIDDMLESPGVREWLQSARPDWLPEFRAYVDERRAAHAAAADAKPVNEAPSQQPANPA